MNAPQAENNSKLYAILFTLGFHALLFLLFILIVFITPIPPFEQVPAPEIEIELGFGSQGMGENAGGSGNKDPDLETSTENSNTAVSAPNVITDNTTSDVTVKTNPNNTQNTNSENTAPPVKEPTELEKLLAAHKANKNKKGKGEGDKNTGGSGNGTDTGTGNGDDPEEGNGPDDGSGGEGGFDLKGWSVIKKPDKLTDAEEEGNVVVKITVDETGKVIKAEPGQRNSTTTSAKLYAKARQAAFQLKYKIKDGVDVKKTQRQAYITFKFTLE